MNSSTLQAQSYLILRDSHSPILAKFYLIVEVTAVHITGSTYIYDRLTSKF